QTRQQRATWTMRVACVRESIWALFVPVIILGGILSGIFTATESGAIAAVYAIIVGMFVHRQISLRDFPDIFMRATLVTGMVIIVLATAGVFSWILITADMPRMIAEALLAVTQSPALIMFLIILFMLFIGAVMEIV